MKYIGAFCVVVIILFGLMCAQDNPKNKTANASSDTEYELLPIMVVSEDASVFELKLNLPQGKKYNRDAPFGLILKSSNDSLLYLGKDTISVAASSFTIPVVLKSGEAILYIDGDLNYCNAENEDICFIRYLKLKLPVTISADEKTEFTLEYDIAG